MSRRVGLARFELLLENLKRNIETSQSHGASLINLKAISGDVAATVTATGGGAALTEAFVCPIDSADDGHKVEMFLASHAGQICIVLNVDSGQDALVRNNADGATLITLGEGNGCILVSSAAGDNWKVVAENN
jgi:hypothetical protein